MKKTIDVQAAVAIAAAEAIAAKTQGTFGVGGVMLDGFGNVLRAVHNNVIRDGLVWDPTAHGERQLVDWYHAEQARGRALPPSHEITIVTSLDPCCMCAGAILQSRISRVVFGAWDDKAGAAGSMYDVLRDRRLPYRAEVIGGTAVEPATALLRDFFESRR